MVQASVTPGTEAASPMRVAPGTVARLGELRERGQRSPVEARDATWEWLLELRERAGRDRDAACATLRELFRAGTPPRDIDGRTEGILLTPLIAGPVDLGIRVLASVWMPWLGKRFNRQTASGDNLLRGSARWPAKLLWPRYETQPLGNDRAAFEFETRVEEGKDDPDLNVLVIDYSVVDSNPGLIIKSIRDELVEVVPGANLGKILWRSGGGSHSLIGYFALRSPVRG